MSGQDVCTLAAAAFKAARDGRDPEVEEALTELIALEEHAPAWWALRARQRLQTGDHRQALADARRVLQLQPRSPEGLVLRTRALAALGDSSVTDSFLEAEKATLTDAQRQEVDALRPQLPKKHTSEDICVLGAQASVAWKQGNVAQAKESFQKLRKLDPATALWAVALARIYLFEENPDDALGLCGTFMATTGSRHAELLLVQGLAQKALGKTEEARADLAEAKLLGGLGEAARRELDGAIAELGPKAEAKATDAGQAPQAKDKQAETGPARSTDAQEKKEPPASSSAAQRPRAEAAPKADAKKEQKQKQDPSSSSASARPPSQAERAAIEAVRQALQAEKAEIFPNARTFCNEAFRSVPHFPQAVLCLARMEMENSAYTAVQTLFCKTHPSVLGARCPGRAQALSLRAAAAERSGDWEAANEDLELLAPLMQSPEPLSPEDGWGPQPEASEVLGRLARSRFYIGKRRAATELADKVMESNSTQLEACEVATKVLMERGDTNVALAVMVRCLVAHRHTPSLTCSQLVGGVMRHCSAEELCKVMTPNPAAANETHQRSVAEVVGYVGLILKERGAVLEASRLYRKALVLAPDHGSLCLNLMHTFALRRDDIRALAWARKFFGLLARSAPRAAALNRALLSEAPDTTQKMFSTRDFPAENEFRDAIAIGFVVLKLLYLAHPRTPLPFCQEGDGRPSWQQRLRDVEVSEEIVGPQVWSLMDDSWRRPPEVVNAAAPRLGAIAAHDQVLRWLVALLGNCCQGLELHLTSIRNENAYFNCIKDILSLSPAKLPRSPALFRPLYVIGDSHVLPTAWQTVEFTAGQGVSYHYVLIPLLVTGVKIWHLRDDSNFYTKFAFWEKLSILPVEAPVMFIIGEIDCREGVLKSVQKGKYDSVEDALYLLIGQYVEVLKQIRKKLVHNHIFLHPVPTVLPETRFLTIAFNSLLSAAPCQAALSQAGVKLLTLDCIFEGGPDAVAHAKGTELSKLSLLPELHLDGTHLSPAYVQSHLRPAMQRVLEPRAL